LNKKAETRASASVHRSSIYILADARISACFPHFSAIQFQFIGIFEKRVTQNAGKND